MQRMLIKLFDIINKFLNTFEYIYDLQINYL